MCFFFFKQKTAYEMRISDWSSDVCSSDLDVDAAAGVIELDGVADHLGQHVAQDRRIEALRSQLGIADQPEHDALLPGRGGEGGQDMLDPLQRRQQFRGEYAAAAVDEIGRAHV